MRRPWLVIGLWGLGCRPGATQAPAHTPGIAAEPIAGASASAASTEPRPTPPQVEDFSDDDEPIEWVEVERVAVPVEAEIFAPRTPRIPAPPRSVDPEVAITRDIIRRIVRAHRGAFGSCYEAHSVDALDVTRIEQLWVVQGDTGRMEIRWTGDPGREPASLMACLREVTADWRFTRPAKASPTGAEEPS